MQLTEEQLVSFQHLWKEQFGEDITLEQAQEEAAALLYFMALSLREPSGSPISQEHGVDDTYPASEPHQVDKQKK